ncbi:MAG: hypothetical protein WAT33_12500 [Giesbergeria sp.]
MTRRGWFVCGNGVVENAQVKSIVCDRMLRTPGVHQTTGSAQMRACLRMLRRVNLQAANPLETQTSKER